MYDDRVGWRIVLTSNLTNYILKGETDESKDRGIRERSNERSDQSDVRDKTRGDTGTCPGAQGDKLY